MNAFTQWASLFVAAVLASWTILHGHKRDDAAKTRAMWERIDAFRKELQAAQVELRVLKERLAAMPSRDVLDNRLQALEDKLERKLDSLGEQMRELLTASK